METLERPDIAPARPAPRAPARRRRRWIVLLAIAAALIAYANLAFFQARQARAELTSARELLDASRRAILDGDVAAARANADRAVALTASADRRGNGLILGAAKPVPYLGANVRAVGAMTRAARYGAVAARTLVEGASEAPIVANRKAVTLHGTDLAPMLRAIEPALPSLERAERSLAVSERAVASAPRRGLVRPVARALDELEREVIKARTEVRVASGLAEVARRLSAPGARTKILLLAQDTWELRPSGGFIGSYGVLEIAGGRIKLVRYDDATALPWPKPELQPTEPLRSALTHPWTLTGAGWWPDFPRSAAAARQLFRNQGGEEVDAVLAITQTFLEDLLRAIDEPVRVPGYPDVLTPENVADRILWHVELKRPLEKPRKRFLTLLTAVLFDRIEHIEASKSPKVLDALSTAFRAKHAQLWFADAEMNEPFSLAGWDGAMRAPKHGDFFSVADANFGTDKANRWTRKRITYRVYWDEQQRPRAEVRVVTENYGKPSPINPLYATYLRVYGPAGARWETTDRMERFLTRVDSENGLLTLGQQQVVYPGQSKEREFNYVLPESVIQHGVYRLTVRPQAGTPEDVYEVRIELGEKPVRATFSGDDGVQEIEAEASRGARRSFAARPGGSLQKLVESCRSLHSCAPLGA